MDIKTEAANRIAAGRRELTFEQFKAEFMALGYRLDTETCKSRARYLTGPNAGQSYPCESLTPIEADTGRRAWHFEARRDGNFQRMQKLRNEVFAVRRGFIAEV